MFIDNKAVVILLSTCIVNFRMGIVEAAVYIGLLIGALSAPLIYNSFGSVIVFAIAAMSILIGLFYCCAFIQESVIMHSNLGNVGFSK